MAVPVELRRIFQGRARQDVVSLGARLGHFEEVAMRWRAVRTGALSALDPTGSYLRSKSEAEPADSAVNRVDDLINTLKQEEGEESAPDGELLKIRAKLSSLRLVASPVTLSMAPLRFRSEAAIARSIVSKLGHDRSSKI